MVERRVEISGGSCLEGEAKILTMTGRPIRPIIRRSTRDPPHYGCIAPTAQVPIRLTENRLVAALKEEPDLFVFAVVILAVAG